MSSRIQKPDPLLLQLPDPNNIFFDTILDSILAILGWLNVIFQLSRGKESPVQIGRSTSYG